MAIRFPTIKKNNIKCFVCCKEVARKDCVAASCTTPGSNETLYVCKGDCENFYFKKGRYEMRFKTGQKVIIDKEKISGDQVCAAGSLNPPYVATISHIGIDPLDGRYMYFFEDCPWGWYDSEIKDIYIKNKKSNNINKTIFNIIDLE
jgi:hypothetical protein